MATQAKLLRAIQNQEVLPVGSLTPHKVNVRIVAATHRDLRAAIAAGEFREDLYYRLSMVELTVPPLKDRPEDVPLRILIPAFVTSELKTAFQIAFAIFIPFLIIDMVVASVLMSMGMMMVSPSVVSLPFKIMLFVLVDGWQLLIASLAQSFY